MAVLGLAASGVAAARLLSSHGIRVYVSDSSDAARASAELLQREWPDTLRAELGGHDTERVAKALGVVVSPGIPPMIPVLAAARGAGVPVVAEAELGLGALGRTSCIAVTGTNGKSTTTAMIAHSMSALGPEVRATGNIGVPVSELVIAGDSPEWLAVELSSFQLHDMPNLEARIAVLTNLSPDHLDRYESYQSYLADKQRLFRNTSDDSITIYNIDDEDSVSMITGLLGRTLGFSTAREADAWFDREANTLMVGGVQMMNRAQLPLLGDHNVANALAAGLAAAAAGFEVAGIGAALATFPGLPHRMEVVAEVDGVTFVNDSKATNVGSTLVAVRAMSGPHVILLGGRHKGEPYSALVQELRRATVGVVAFGEAAAQIEGDLKGHAVVEVADDLNEAVGIALELLDGKGSILLSPACSSYDQFPNYRARGDAFRSIVEAL